MAKRKRQRACFRAEYTLAGKFPSHELPFPECKACLVLRQDNDEYLCAVLSPRTGRYVLPLTTFPKQIKLADRIVIDGSPIPAGTMLTVVSPASGSEGYWCKAPRKGKHQLPTFFVNRNKTERNS